MSRLPADRPPRRFTQRRLLAAWLLCLGAASAPAEDQPVDFADVWVELDLAPLGRSPREADPASLERRDRLERQQDEVMARLAALGAVEQGRVRIVRNAIAVRLPRASIAAARQLPGVRRITPVRHVRTQPDHIR